MRIAFCGHSHHRTTGSSAFVVDLLRERGDVVEVWDDAWLTGRALDPAPLLEGRFDAIVVWQVEGVAERLAAAAHPNVTFFPMYDGCHAKPDSFWRSLDGVKVVCFSSTLHERVQRLGATSRFVRYAPDPAALGRASPVAAPAGYFWQRQQDVTWATIRPLLGETRFERFTVHRAMDPSHGPVVAPSADDVARYRLRTTAWFETREAALADLCRHNVYFAPRLREGIGLSFLEAMAMGFLVVAPDRPTMSEYVVSGVNGLLYDPERPAPLDLSRHLDLGARARHSIARAREAWERCVPALLDFVVTPAAEVARTATLDAFDPLALRRASRPGDRGRGDRPADPLVTVAVLGRDRDPALAATLDSVRAQDLARCELVLLDPGARDGTADAWAARNAAAAAARGRYVLFLDAGDVLPAADTLSRAVEGTPSDADAIVGHHVARHAGGDEDLRLARALDDTWARLRAGRVDRAWLAGVPARQATLLRTEWLRANPYRTDLGDAAHDDLLWRLAASGARVHHALSVVAVEAPARRAASSRTLADRRRVALARSAEPDAAAAGFAAVRAELAREELPRLATAEVLLRLGRVRGARKELSARVRRFRARHHLV